MGLREVYSEWQRRRRESRLYAKFADRPAFDTLTRLLEFLSLHGRPLSLEREPVRRGIIALQWTQLAHGHAPDLQRIVADVMEAHLRESPTGGDADCWRTWLTLSRLGRYELPVHEPAFATRLLIAKRRGHLHELPPDEARYLLAACLASYEQMLAGTGDATLDMLPVVIEYTAIARALGRDSGGLLERWLAHAKHRPRALSNFSDEQAYDAPIRGIGSPNGTTVTTYQNDAGNPVRLVYAGITGDATLNIQVMSSLFATALACDSDTFLTTVGGVLRLPGGEQRAAEEPRPAMLAATLGIDGAGTGRPGVAPLGMDPADALTLSTDLFQRFREETGVIAMSYWSAADGDALDAKAAAAMRDTMRTHVIRSDPSRSEAGRVIHVTPLLRRDHDGAVEPVRIEIPSTVLQPAQALKLVRGAREAYMAELIAGGKRREHMARSAYEHHSAAMKAWRGATPAERAEICRVAPFVTVTQSYDFDLGILVPVDPPEKIAREKYEEEVRPRIRDAAAEYVKRFAELCARLDQLNAPGGVADRLALGVLTDAALRGEDLPVGNAGFRDEFRAWAAEAAGPAWLVVTEWARRTGYPVELLAADNILFKATLDQNRTVVLEPHAMIDLQDFEIITNRDDGVMCVFSGGRTRTLRESIAPDVARGIDGPAALHEQFLGWVSAKVAPPGASLKRMEIRKRLLADKRTAGLLHLAAGKRALFNGELRHALEEFQEGRRADMAPIYLWGAIAAQAIFMEGSGFRPDASVRDPEQRRHALLNAAAGAVAEWLRGDPPLPFPMPGDKRGVDAVFYLFEQAQRPALDPLAESFAHQLRARDLEYASEFIGGNADLAKLEQAWLRITDADTQRVRALGTAVGALELLELAESMRDAADTLPAGGHPARELHKQLRAIIDSARMLRGATAPGLEQLEELASRLRG